MGTFRPEPIALLGSRARGDATVDSDIDLMMVGASELSMIERYRAAARSGRELGWQRDVLWFTPAEVAD